MKLKILLGICAVLLRCGSVTCGLFDLPVLNILKLGKESKSEPDSKKTIPLLTRSSSEASKAEQSRFGNQDEVSGFLGVESLINPIIKLTKEVPGSPLPEPPCERTYFMSPFSEPKWIYANASIKTRLNPSCYWNIIGTEACIPMIECPTFNLDPKNNKTKKHDEYLQIFDGNEGLGKFYENHGPRNATAASGLRDLFVKFQTTKHEGDVDPNIEAKLKFNCSISCSNRRQGKPLPLSFKPKKSELCSCGKKSNENRIINGEETERGEFPWMVGLVQKNTRQVFCGGALINDRMVLTAAHCIKGIFLNVNNLEVILNAHVTDTLPNMHVVQNKTPPIFYHGENLTQVDEDDKSLRLSVEELIIHPLYVTESNEFDVALLKLSSPIDQINMTVQNPVCLPKLGSFMRTYAKLNATVAGWGLSEPEARATSPILQKLIVNVFSPVECKNYYAHRVSRRSLCAGFDEGGKDSCMGDSGGPLILEDKPEVWYQIGTVSWGESCAEPKNPGVYFRTTESGPWIHYHSNRNNAIWCDVPT